MEKSWFFVTFLFIAVCESFSVENLSKCSIKDNECQKKLYQNVIKDVGKTGIPDLGIPVLDPIALKNVNVAILDVANLTLVDGVAKGIKDCIVNSYEIDIEKGIGQQQVTCDFVIKGQYSLSGESDLLKQLLGSNGLRGEGKAKVKLEKLVMNMKYPVTIVKHDDGETYYSIATKEMEYTYDIKGKASFAADNIYAGKENISEFVVKYLNENWKYLLRTFGKSFVDKAMEFYIDFCTKFFGGVSTKNFIIEDLTPYLKE